MGIHTVVIPARNDKDVKELPANVKRGMEFVFVDHMDQVLEIALAKQTRAKRRLGVALSAKRGATSATGLRAYSPSHLYPAALAQGTSDDV
jgi:ATP-dependent Lon protease